MKGKIKFCLVGWGGRGDQHFTCVVGFQSESLLNNVFFSISQSLLLACVRSSASRGGSDFHPNPCNQVKTESGWVGGGRRN